MLSFENKNEDLLDATEDVLVMALDADDLELVYGGCARRAITNKNNFNL